MLLRTGNTSLNIHASMNCSDFVDPLETANNWSHLHEVRRTRDFAECQFRFHL